MVNAPLTEPIGVPAPLATAQQLIDTDHGHATRFLQRATFGPRPGDVEHLQAIGVDAWFDEQMSMESGLGHADMLLDDSSERLQNTVWRSFLSHDDQLRKRVGYALSQILVVSDTSVGSDAVAGYADMLNRQAFGNFRELLENVSLSPAMGRYLSHARNAPANPDTGSMPDENFARELMQLFTIGLWELDSGGTRRTDRGAPIPTYDNNDVMGLARVMTGWENVPSDTDRAFEQPMIVWEPTSRWHEHGEKQFLRTFIEADTGAERSLEIALDALFEHANTAPFICHQLIQRLVTSNPTPQYVQRVAAVFNGDGRSERGDLGQVVRAILLDQEAMSDQPSEWFGKIREPVLRFSTVLRMMGVVSDRTPWLLGNLSNQATAIGQQPLLAPSVFNFYRPGFVPSDPAFAGGDYVSPEMQIANETSAIGWVNKLARTMKWSPAGISFAIDDLLELADDPGGLVDEVEQRLCPGRVSVKTRSVVLRTLTGIAQSNEEVRRNERVLASVLLIAASTDFIYER